ncbi:hypothetical protein [Rhizobium leguminosarum]|uniref:hypothetical protein n=1 Tax=Rhizobium leguminosarum TaxID=384 RepID=UPI001C96917C|nr:hypothetical protein [Rhizobium leguminosarum]
MPPRFRERLEQGSVLVVGACEAVFSAYRGINITTTGVYTFKGAADAVSRLADRIIHFLETCSAPADMALSEQQRRHQSASPQATESEPDRTGGIPTTTQLPEDLMEIYGDATGKGVTVFKTTKGTGWIKADGGYYTHENAMAVARCCKKQAWKSMNLLAIYWDAKNNGVTVFNTTKGRGWSKAGGGFYTSKNAEKVAKVGNRRARQLMLDLVKLIPRTNSAAQ